MATLTIPQDLLERFLRAVVLLQILNPVREHTSANDVDHEHDEIEQSRAIFLKQKFLDSFALISASRKGGNYVAAACIEEGQKEGSIIRVARNAGVPKFILDSLQAILDDLTKIGHKAPDANSDHILRKIVLLDESRIRKYAEDILDNLKEFVVLRSKIEQIQQSNSNISTGNLQSLLVWVDNMIEFAHTNAAPSCDVLMQYIRWAQKARSDHMEPLKSLYSSQEEELPKWIRTVLKLGRYGVAARALIQLALEFPALFCPMRVKAVEAPSPVTVPRKRVSLHAALKNIMGEKSQEYHSRLFSLVNPQKQKNVEKWFRNRYPSDLLVHAEMQLLSYYDQRPKVEPTLRFIGVSKKSCYLCKAFLSFHHPSFKVSACHWKVYTRWITPPAANERIFSFYRGYTAELTQMLEAEVRRDLEDRSLGRPKQAQFPADSSAGVSMTGLSGFEIQSATSRASPSIRIELMKHFLDEGEASGTRESKGKARITELHSTLTAPSIVSLERISDPADRGVASPAIGHSSWLDKSSPLAIVLHFTRPGDAKNREIVCLADIFDSSTGYLSYDKLIKILANCTGFGLAFNKEKEFLVFNGQLVVENERQFIACVQYLYNADHLNAEVVVCSREDCRFITDMRDVETQTEDQTKSGSHKRMRGWLLQKRKWCY